MPCLVCLKRLFTPKRRWQRPKPEYSGLLREIIICIKHQTAGNLGERTLITTRKVYRWLNGYNEYADATKCQIIARFLRALYEYRFLEKAELSPAGRRAYWALKSVWQSLSADEIYREVSRQLWD